MATIKSIKVKPKKKIPSAITGQLGKTSISANTMGSNPVDLSSVSASSPFKATAMQTGSQAVPGANKVPATPVPSANSVNDQLALMEQQQANIYDPTIGYGQAAPGETGVAAVARIKKAKVKPKGK